MTRRTKAIVALLATLAVSGPSNAQYSGGTGTSGGGGGTANALPLAGGTMTGPLLTTATALTSGTTIATNAAAGNVFTLTLAANATLANPTGLAAAQELTWIVKQDTTGSRTLAYGTLFDWPNQVTPTLSTAAGAVDLITGIYDGTKIRMSIVQGY